MNQNQDYFNFQFDALRRPWWKWYFLFRFKGDQIRSFRAAYRYMRFYCYVVFKERDRHIRLLTNGSMRDDLLKNLEEFQNVFKVKMDAMKLSLDKLDKWDKKCEGFK